MELLHELLHLINMNNIVALLIPMAAAVNSITVITLGPNSADTNTAINTLTNICMLLLLLHDFLFNICNHALQPPIDANDSPRARGRCAP